MNLASCHTAIAGFATERAAPEAVVCPSIPLRIYGIYRPPSAPSDHAREVDGTSNTEDVTVPAGGSEHVRQIVGYYGEVQKPLMVSQNRPTAAQSSHGTPPSPH